MKILFATSEAVPFCKTGGLGDVCGSLPTALTELGHQVTLILPGFRQALQSGQPIEPTGIEFEVPIGRKMVRGSLLESKLPDSDVTVYLVENRDYYDRPELYLDHEEEYRDNCERFVFYNRAVLEAIRLLDLDVDILHAHDWTAGLLPVYLRTEFAGIPPYDKIQTVFTIHNLAYQGNFWHWDMELTGIDWKYFNWRQLEFYGHLSFMKGALAFADTITTVSPQYAKEILSQPLSCGMEGILGYREEDLFGIINGVDYQTWNPEVDPHLEGNNYSVETWETGKAACKQALLEQVGLPSHAGTPLLAIVGRLVDQKGFDLLAQILPTWAETKSAQWVILGTGEARYHESLSQIAEQFPEQVAVRLEFSNALAHQIEAGADIFVMPSRFEPCGLNQLYSLKYGTVPVVRATGGLHDTVTDTTTETLADDRATGFSFGPATAEALSGTLERACYAYADQEIWRKIVRNGMMQDWSWQKSAQLYANLYEGTNVPATGN